jgi:hypothetical protein
MPEDCEEAAPPKPTAASPGHVVVAGHACILGALEATQKLAGSLFDGDRADWIEEFNASSAKHAAAMSPLGEMMVKGRSVPEEADASMPSTTRMPMF